LEAKKVGVGQYVQVIKNLEYIIKTFRTFGSPTFFLTLNPAEKDWEELEEAYRKVHNIPPEEKIDMHEMIQKDPGVFSEHFNLRCLEMFKHLQKKKGPLKGKLKHYWYRIEYQERGAPHIHALLWIDGAPVIGKNSPEEILQFISDLITCRLPDKDKEPLLHKLVTKYQIHRCTGNFYNQCVLINIF